MSFKTNISLLIFHFILVIELFNHLLIKHFWKHFVLLLLLRIMYFFIIDCMYSVIHLLISFQLSFTKFFCIIPLSKCIDMNSKELEDLESFYLSLVVWKFAWDSTSESFLWEYKGPRLWDRYRSTHRINICRMLVVCILFCVL